jgi:hypothetical protein
MGELERKEMEQGWDSLRRGPIFVFTPLALRGRGGNWEGRGEGKFESPQHKFLVAPLLVAQWDS